MVWVKAGSLQIAQPHPDQLVAVIVHGAVIAAAMPIAIGARPFAFLGLTNESVRRIVINADRIIVCSFNETFHLDYSKVITVLPSAFRSDM